MAGPCSTFTCRLYRDGLQTPWGIRLQGGKDFNQPLTVQRVFTGSPAEGELQRGDVIVKINNIDAAGLPHKAAQDIIKTPAGQLVLSIQRGQTRFSPIKGVQPPQSSQFQSTTPTGFRSVPFGSSSSQKPLSPPTGGMNFAVDYTGRVGSPSRRPEQTMINRVQDSLNEAVWAHQTGEPDDYSYETVRDRKKIFSQDTRSPLVHAPGKPSRTGRGWRPPPAPHSDRPQEFGWTPSKRVDPSYRPGPPTQERAYSPPRHTPAASRARVVTHLPDDSGQYPVWKGTLHAPGEAAPPPLEHPRSVKFSPTKPSTMPHPHPNHPRLPQQQSHGVQQHGGQHGGPKVVHKQYNSPIGLYSKQNIDEAYTGQTQALQHQSGLSSGDGNMDFTKSYAWQMIKQSESTPGGGPTQQTTAESHYQEKQSRSFTALEREVEASDF